MTLPMSQPQTVTTETLPPEWQNLATKADVAEVRGDVAELRTRMEFMATKEDIAELRTRLEYTVTKEDLAEKRKSPSGLSGSLMLDELPPGLTIGLLFAAVQVALFFLLRSLG